MKKIIFQILFCTFIILVCGRPQNSATQGQGPVGGIGIGGDAFSSLAQPQAIGGKGVGGDATGPNSKGGEGIGGKADSSLNPSTPIVPSVSTTTSTVVSKYPEGGVANYNNFESTSVPPVNSTNLINKLVSDLNETIPVRVERAIGGNGIGGNAFGSGAVGGQGVGGNAYDYPPISQTSVVSSSSSLTASASNRKKRAIGGNGIGGDATGPGAVGGEGRGGNAHDTPTPQVTSTSVMTNRNTMIGTVTKT